MNIEKLLELYIEYVKYLLSICNDTDIDCYSANSKMGDSLFNKLQELERLMLIINPDNEYAYERHEVE